MTRLFGLKSLWALPVLLLLGCSDRPFEIVEASVPSRIHSKLLQQDIWAIVVHASANMPESLNNGGSLYIFKSDCAKYNNIEEIGYRLYNDSGEDPRLKFALKDKYFQGDGYRGVAKGDCVFVKTDHTYRFISPRYRSNIITLH